MWTRVGAMAVSAVLALATPSDSEESPSVGGAWGSDAENYGDTAIIEGTTGSTDGQANSPRSNPRVVDTGTPATLPLPPAAAPVPLQRVDPRLGFEVPDCRPDETGASADWTCWSPQAQQFFIVPPGSDDADDEETDDNEAPGVSLGDLAGAVREFTRVQISPAPVIVQPDQDWHLVNLPVVVRTEPQGQSFDAQLLGLPVEIRAEPVSYSWDFGDGSEVLNTTDPGGVYPDHSLEHTYTGAGEYQITLFTYWSGSFRVGGGPWIDIDGLGVTAAVSPVLSVEERTTRLTG